MSPRCKDPFPSRNELQYQWVGKALGVRIWTCNPSACLPGAKTHFPVGMNCSISGWGKLSEYGSGPAILQQAQVPLTSQKECEDAYQYYDVTSRMIWTCNPPASSSTVDVPKRM